MMGMLTCKEASHLASKSLDAPLSWRERAGLRLHLMFCRLCRRYVRDLRFLRLAFQRAGHGDVRPATLRLSEPARRRIQKVLSGTNDE